MNTVTSDASKVGERLKFARRLLGKTQNEVAEALGLTQALLSRLENGKNTISYAHAERLDKLFGINKYWLLEGHGKPLERSGEPPMVAGVMEGVLLPSFRNVTNTFKVGTDSMAPELKRGDLVLCDRTTIESMAADAMGYFITTKFRMFRQLKRVTANSVILSALDGQTMDVTVPREELKEAYAVRYVIRDYQ